MTKGAWWNAINRNKDNLQNNFADDRFFTDMEIFGHVENANNVNDKGVNAEVKPAILESKPMADFNKWHNYKDYKFDQAYTSYYNYYKLLMLLGLDGMNLTLIDSPRFGDQPVFREPGFYGLEKNLAPGMRFFPPDINFSQLYLYGDTDDRSLIHQTGQHLEKMTPYFQERSNSIRTPLTSIINFKTDSLYPAGLPQPDFYGYRIDFQGLSDPDEFYRVDYSLDPIPEQGDFRRTLYWNPSLVTDNEGRAKVEFYNNGFSRRLNVSAEGLTPKGFITKEIVQ
jgi:hypothetical protein